MRKFQIEQTLVYCLHIRKYRETSAILDCFSKDYGRLDMLGKGLYRPKQRSAIPGYFQEYKLSGICKTELGTLTGLEATNSRIELKGQAWLTACYCNELLIKFLPRAEALPEVYYAYQNVLLELARDQDHKLALLWFEKRLIESLGYGINFYSDTQYEDEIKDNFWYEYVVSSGFKPCSKNLKNALPGFVILALANESWSEREDEYFALAKKVVRTALKYQLGNIELKTVSVRNELNKIVEL